jgi:hypothetical protein
MAWKRWPNSYSGHMGPQFFHYRFDFVNAGVSVRFYGFSIFNYTILNLQHRVPIS